MNCEGMDRVGAKLLDFIEGRKVVQECQSDADLKPLLDAIMSLMVAITSDLEGTSIVRATQDIVTMIENLDVLCIGISIKIRIQTVVISIKDVVTTYVSQIALAEQRRLQITGSLTFSLSVQLEQEPEPFDFELREKVQRQQLKGLMVCGDFTDRSTQSIFVSQQVSDPKGGNCDGDTILKRAQRVTAMCGANDLQLDDIRSNTQELARCSAELREPLTERQLKSLKFILVILSSFRVTFSSQIAFVQQKLSILAGQKISAAELGIQFVGSDGQLFDVEAERQVVPLNPLGEPGNALKYEIILTEDWQDLRFVFTTMKTVILSVVRVLDLQGISGLPPGGSVNCSDFLASLQVYFKMISQGSFARDEIFDITLEIITSSPKVDVECSARVRFLAESILKSVMNYQLLFTTDLVILQMKLTQILRVQVTSLQITFAGISEEGSSIEYQQGVACELRQENFYRETISQHRTSIENIQGLCDSVSALLNVQENTASSATCAVSSSEFMEELGSLVIGLSEDVNSLDAQDLLAIQSLSVSTSFSDREVENLVFIKSTLLSYITQLGSEIAYGQSALQDLDESVEGSQLPFCLTCSPIGTSELPLKLTRGQLPYKLTPKVKGQLPYKLTPKETGQLPYKLTERGQTPYRLNSMQTSQTPYSESPLCLTCGGESPLCLTCEEDVLSSQMPLCLTCKETTTDKNSVKMEMLKAMNQTYVMLSSTLVSLTSSNEQCNPREALSPSKFLEYIHKEIYGPLIFKEWTQLDGSSNAVSLDPVILQDIPCGTKSNERDILVIKVALQEYLKIVQFAMAQVHAELLAVICQCQNGLAPGDWSDGSGECCCQPDDATVETSISLQSSQGSSGQVCHSVKKACVCRLPQATSSLPYKFSRTSTPPPSHFTSSTPYMLSHTPATTLQSTTEETMTTFVQIGLIPLKLRKRFSTSTSSTPF